MDKDKLQEILDLHKKWLSDLECGELADLRNANLRGAYLRGANLRGADLGGAKGIISIEPIGSRGDTLIACKHETCIMIKAGCFWGTLDEFVASVEKNHGDSIYGRAYMAAVELIKIQMEGR